MVRQRLTLFTLLCFLFCTHANGESNGWSSNGGEYLFEADNPWNLGTEAVPYCVMVKQGYPLSLADAKAMVAEGFRLWREFFAKYSLDAAEFGASALDGRLVFQDHRSRRLSLDFVEKDCSSGDDPSTVRFLFGVESEVVSKYLDVASDGSVGVAMRQAYNHQSFRNGGYVWVAQFTDDISRIRHVLLHEMGHIFGMPHDSVYVMDQDVALSVRNVDKFDSNNFGTIEADFWPYRMRPGDRVNLSSRLGHRILRAEPSVAKLCRVLDARPNRTLPVVLRRSFALEKDGCYRTVLHAGAKGELSKAQEFRLEIANEDGNALGFLEGRMVTAYRRRLDNPSPGLVTRWLNAVTGGTRYVRLPLDPALPMAPARGSFVFEGREHAARIEIEKGLQLEIFIGGRWWRLRSPEE